MKQKALFFSIIIFIIAMISVYPALGEDCCPAGDEKNMNLTREVNGYLLEYEFIDISEKMKEMADMGHTMGNMTATHHLMVYIRHTDGGTVAADKVGFLIAGPDGKDQKVMAMGMNGGYGADVTLNLSGEYTVKTKAVIGSSTLLDAFAYSVE
jgi:hypothetical protein